MLVLNMSRVKRIWIVWIHKWKKIDSWMESEWFTATCALMLWHSFVETKVNMSISHASSILISHLLLLPSLSSLLCVCLFLIYVRVLCTVMWNVKTKTQNATRKPDKQDWSLTVRGVWAALRGSEFTVLTKLPFGFGALLLIRLAEHKSTVR